MAQSVAVTFQVDMSKESISNDGIHIAGSFQSVAGFGDNWNPSTTRLDDTDGDKVYSLTLEMPSGTYEYKFINGKEWGKDENPPVECSVGNTNNRVITVGDKDLVIPSVPFNGCVGMIKLAVNMNGETVSPEGVHVMGNFQKAAGYETDWDASSTKLVDVNGDNTYEVNLMLPAGNYEYLFVNGNESLDTESLPLDCSIEGENGTNNRTLTVELGSANPPIYCFNSCDECNPNLNTDYDTHWWNDAVFYELFVRSFYDSDGDGIGDFRGIIEKLDYLNDGDPNTDKDLGITAIWLMPMMESPSYHGYDATDYYKTEPDYGTMEDFTAFLEEAHNRGIKVIIDLVLNHTSNQHPWFTQSKTNSNGFRDWYIWSEDNPNFSGPWGQGVWHGSGSDYYYGLFWSGMPDLNYNHPDVKEEMFNVANFWLDKGVDGFRLDAIKYLIEDGTVLENTSGTFSLLEEFDEVYKSNNADAFSIGEVWSNTASIIPYVQNERLDVCFEFDLAGHILNAVINENSVSVRQQMLNVNASYPSLQYGTFLSNHDMDRVYDILGSSVSKLKLAASIYLTLPGIPFLYYGEEVNMSGTGAHENIRRPMQWSDAANAGFSTSTPWNNAGSNYVTNNVVVMENNPNSLLNHYKRLIRIRNEQKALRRGYYLDVESSEANVYSFARIYENEGIVVVSNLATQLSNASLSLKASTLLPGNYKVTDLYNDEEMGMISINEKGGFENWESTTEMSAQSTRVLLISDVNSVSTNNISKAFFDFKLSPNPTIDEVNISWESAPEPRANVKVISTNGAIIYQETSSDNAMTIQTKGWSSGIYFVQITVDGKIGSQRLVIL
ncbi:alpha-amylase family glycosyl hydrolase [Portibacter lacus]|nr:alpha-amylase family glycosyl hydrolase [Portibacter lacus]